MIHESDQKSRSVQLKSQMTQWAVAWRILHIGVKIINRQMIDDVNDTHQSINQSIKLANNHCQSMSSFSFRSHNTRTMSHSFIQNQNCVFISSIACNRSINQSIRSLDLTKITPQFVHQSLSLLPSSIHSSIH